MEGNVQDMFVMFWFGYAFFMIGIIAIALVWAIKSGQFRRSGHASSLPLEIEEDNKEGGK